MTSDMATVAPPPPAPGGPPQLNPAGRTAIRVALVAAAALLVVATVTALGATAWGVSTFRVLTDTKSLPATMRSLVVDTGDMPMMVQITADRSATEPRAQLRVANSNQSGEHRLDVSSDRDGSRIGINGDSTSLLGWARGGEITITLPSDQARRLAVHTRQKTGVLLAQADVDELQVRTTAGQVILDGSARRIDVQGVHAGIVTRNPISVADRLTASTSDGSVALDFKDAAPRTVEATSRDGDVTIGLPGAGPYLVRAQSGATTKIRVPETTSAADAVAEITARSDDGDVVVDTLGFTER